MSKNFVALCFGSLVVNTFVINTTITSLVASPATAETVMERVARTGVLTAGTRTDSIPFAYRNTEGDWVGYSIDLLGLIQAELAQQLGKPIELDLVEVDTGNRITEVSESVVDIVCGSTSYTSNRSRLVDFSIGFFRTGTQFLVKRGNNLELGQLRVGVITGTTNTETVEGYLRIAQFIPMTDRAMGLAALEADRIDALVSDGILLEGLRQSIANPDAYEIIPPSPIEPEVYSCIVPKDNPDFLALVNQTLVNFMQGAVEGDSQDMTTIERWFGAEGVAPIDNEQLLDFFTQSIKYHQDR
ncbi:MAG TPA: amino acid ABC transporter substrate-binding protein [Allocoleopsis sp.]